MRKHNSCALHSGYRFFDGHKANSEQLARWRVTRRARVGPEMHIGLFGDLIDSRTESRCQMYRVPRFKPRQTERGCSLL